MALASSISGCAPLITVLGGVLFAGQRLGALAWVRGADRRRQLRSGAPPRRAPQRLGPVEAQLRHPVCRAGRAAVGLCVLRGIGPVRTVGPVGGTLWLELGVALVALPHASRAVQPALCAAFRDPGCAAQGVLVSAGGLLYSLGVAHFTVGVIAAPSNSTAVLCALIGAVHYRQRLTRSQLVLCAVMIAAVAGQSA